MVTDDTDRPLIWVQNWEPSASLTEQTPEALAEHRALGAKYTHGPARVMGPFTAELIARLGIVGLYRPKLQTDCP